MNIEIEKKFLVKNNDWRKEQSQGILYKQGYLCIDRSRTVRVRVGEDHCHINIKGRTDERFRLEFEYEIPRKDALVLLHTVCLQPVIRKTRYTIKQGELCWEVDEFHDENEGLIMAEIELAYPDQAVDLPDWIGKEVTDDPGYYNASLVLHPYQNRK